jgi:hypothetical protein
MRRYIPGAISPTPGSPRGITARGAVKLFHRSKTTKQFFGADEVIFLNL